MSSEPNTNRRNPRSHKAIVDATLKLLGSNGYVDFSIEKVASEAGVGKQTIYRWWPSRAELVLEVWRDRLLPPLAPYAGKMPVRDFLESSLLSFGKVLSRTDCRQAAICVLAEAHRDPQLYQRMADAVYLPRINSIMQAFKHAQEKGEFSQDIDIDVAIYELFGAVWYKVLIRFGTVDKAYIKKLVRQFFRSNS